MPAVRRLGGADNDGVRALDHALALRDFQRAQTNDLADTPSMLAPDGPGVGERGSRTSMHAIVLLKQILDWELPPSRFRIDPQAKRPAEGLGPTLLGPFEQNALELALQLKDA